jgi:S-DNA-T family DNA segregation ATPase FtsK/SpoIIIE
VSGQPIVADLGSMPHLLIAGATGSGKSVCINAVIVCLICDNTPDELKLILIDPKRVELTNYNGIPHLQWPVLVDSEKAVQALQWAVREMERRLQMFARRGARNLDGYQKAIENDPNAEKLPYLVIIVDELADLMMVAPDDVEHGITRLAQLARATGIHLVLATQRPSVDVVTGLIKANFPARISFAVTSQIDSRVVLDTPGAETLLGRGDMLYMAPDSSKLLRLQGCFVSDRELEKVVNYWQAFAPEQTGIPLTTADGGPLILQPIPGAEFVQESLLPNLKKKDSDEDDLLGQAIQVVQQSDRASVSLLQRKLRIGYSRAARLIDLLEAKGYVGRDEGPARGRPVLIKGSPSAPSASPSAQAPRDFRQAEGDDFDDWDEEDWEDLDKG